MSKTEKERSGKQWQLFDFCLPVFFFFFLIFIRMTSLHWHRCHTWGEFPDWLLAVTDQATSPRHRQPQSMMDEEVHVCLSVCVLQEVREGGQHGVDGPNGLKSQTNGAFQKEGGETPLTGFLLHSHRRDADMMTKRPSRRGRVIRSAISQLDTLI